MLLNKIFYKILRKINRIFFKIPGKIFFFMRKLVYYSYKILIYKFIYKFIYQFILLYDYLTSKWFYKKDSFEIYHCNPAEKKNILCIFSHFDINNIIDPYVIFYLQELSKNGCDIIFVSASILSESERNKISSYCKQIIIRKNRGRDFGSFKCGILNSIDIIKNYEKVILANDSVYGPFFDLSSMISYGDNNNLDMWGASNSIESGYHIQSYFVIFNKKIINHPIFLKFWKKVYYLNQRQNIINHYELGMSKYFQKNGFELGAFCDYLKIQKDLFSKKNLIHQLDKKTQKLLRKQYAVNPTHALWKIIITNYKFPFLKRELLLHNPESLDIYHWDALVKTHSHFDVDLIVKHLLRLSTRAEN